MPTHSSSSAKKEPKQALEDAIREIHPISQENQKKLLDAFEEVSYDKNTQIIKGDEIPVYMYFVVKGIIRVYYTNEDKELIDWFAEEGCFIGNLYSYIMRKPGFDIYESIEDVVLLRARYTDLERLLAHSHEIERLAREIIQLYYVKYVERVHHLKGLPAEEKYHHFVHHYGAFVNRIPLKYVANYLGITSETLSRIRARDNKKVKK